MQNNRLRSTVATSSGRDNVFTQKSKILHIAGDRYQKKFFGYSCGSWTSSSLGYLIILPVEDIVA